MYKSEYLYNPDRRRLLRPTDGRARSRSPHRHEFDPGLRLASDAERIYIGDPRDIYTSHKDSLAHASILSAYANQPKIDHLHGSKLDLIHGSKIDQIHDHIHGSKIDHIHSIQDEYTRNRRVQDPYYKIARSPTSGRHDMHDYRLTADRQRFPSHSAPFVPGLPAGPVPDGRGLPIDNPKAESHHLRMMIIEQSTMMWQFSKILENKDKIKIDNDNNNNRIDSNNNNMNNNTDNNMNNNTDNNMNNNTDNNMNNNIDNNNDRMNNDRMNNVNYNMNNDNNDINNYKNHMINTPYGKIDLSPFGKKEWYGIKDQSEELNCIEPAPETNVYNECSIEGIQESSWIPSTLSDKQCIRVCALLTCGWDTYKRSITEALALISDDSRMTILIDPGTYHETLRIKFPVRIIGTGAGVIVRYDTVNTCQITADNVHIENIVVRNEPDTSDHTFKTTQGVHCVLVSSKNVVIKDCDLLSMRGHCICVEAPQGTPKTTAFSATEPFKATLLVSACRLHNSSNCGVFVSGRCHVSVRDTVIEQCKAAGIEGRDYSVLNLFRTTIKYCGKSGAFVHSNASCLILSSDINNCGMAALELAKQAHGRILYSRVFHGLRGGIFVHDSAYALLQSNQIFSNFMSNVDVRTCGNVEVQHTKITESRASGVYISAKGECTLYKNQILRNMGNGVELNSGRLICSENEINDNHRCALFANGDCTGELSGNDLRFNREKSVGNHAKGTPPRVIGNNMMDEGRSSLRRKDDNRKEEKKDKNIEIMNGMMMNKFNTINNEKSNNDKLNEEKIAENHQNLASSMVHPAANDTSCYAVNFNIDEYLREHNSMKEQIITQNFNQS